MWQSRTFQVTTEPTLCVFPTRNRETAWLGPRRTHRAIGVVYHPERDHRGNWVPTVLGGRSGRVHLVRPHPRADPAPR